MTRDRIPATVGEGIDLPEGFALEVGRRGRLGRANDVAAALATAGFGVDGDSASIPASDLSGRYPLGRIDANGRELLVRRFAHGGLFRWLTGERFADPDRPFDELRLAARLRRAGVRTPAVVAARAVRAGWLPGWRLALVSERVPASRDLATVMERHRAGEGEPLERHQLIRELGSLLRSLHDFGFEHVDLQLRNLLARREAPSGARLWIIDLDRSRLGPPLVRQVRERNLARLLRSARRRDRRGTPILASTDLVRLLIAYAGRDHWREWHARLESRAERTAWRHRLGWWLERRAGANPSARDGSATIR